MNCFPAGRYYPGIASLLRLTVTGLVPGIDPETPTQLIPIVSVDCESTDRDPLTARVIEVAMVTAESSSSTLVNPGVPVPQDATAIHGITDADVADALPFAWGYSALPLITLPLAYNADYDRTLLTEECKRADIVEPACSYAWLDPLVWARYLRSDLKSHSLGAMCSEYQISMNEAHRAENDARAALMLWECLRTDPRVPTTYAALIREQKRLAAIQEEQRKWWKR